MLRSWSLATVLLLSLFLQSTLAIVLQEIRPRSVDGNGAYLGKRSDPDLSALDLRSSEIFLWGGVGSTSAVFGNFTVYMPGDTENIVSMEKFSGMLEHIDCTADGLTLKFKDDATFAYAKKVWDWVNGADDHAFVMVAGAGDCGMNAHRQPFLVSKLAYDEDQNIARLTSTPQDWKTIAHSYDLQVGNVDFPDGGLQSRDLTYDASMSLFSAFPFSFAVTEDGLTSKIECSDCYTHGTMALQLKISQVALIPVGASMRLAPRGVSAEMKVTLTESGTLDSAKSFNKTVASIPLDAIEILDGIVSIGPFLDILIGFEISAISGSASVSSGATVTLSDSAILELDLLNPSNNQFSGWVPSVDPIPLAVDAKISGGIAVFAQLSLDLKAEALDHGYEIGLELKMPNIAAQLTFIDSPTGACKTDHLLGVQIAANIGASLKVEASEIGDESDPFLSLTIATVSFPLAQHCWPFGPTIPGGGTTSTKGPPPSLPVPTSGLGNDPPSSGPGNAPPSGSTTLCINNSGISGTCISTGSCSSGGGTSEAGHCPGAADIQCCTYASGTPSKDIACTVNSGLSGTCITTSQCSGAGGQSEAGHCPGAADIQCCTYPAGTSTNKNTCTINSGLKGTCISTTACQKGGGASEAGHCPGSAEIQCCTYPEQSSTTSASPSAPTTCTVNSGVKGNCISTTACQKGGGTSEAGHCPGAADIQCCTYPEQSSTTTASPSAPTTCTVNSGIKGNCISTTACQKGGGTSEAGHCPGAADIQCCTYPEQSSTTSAEPPTSTTCTVNSGIKGNCISTTACQKGGGTSEAGHCPGAADIQCCTYPEQSSTTSATPPTSTTCTVNSGIKGNCISTTACQKGGGTSEAGHCPGAADIQCCTYPEQSTFVTSTTSAPPSSATGSCKVDSGQLGSCMSTSACSSAGGKSEAGHCPGAANIQCCTYGSCTASGKKGFCQPTSSCTGTSTPGLCPGASDIQCCT